MRNVPLGQAPNQTLSVNLDGNRWQLTLTDCNGSMTASVALNGDQLTSCLRVCVGTPLLPYPAIAGSGNFLYLTDNDELPDWRKIGVTQSLVYVTAQEYLEL